MKTIRPVKEIIEPQMVIEGAGVLLRRSISPQISNQFDPFLLFDHFAFNDPVEGPILGFPMHPHRGIETVTYMLTGSVRHRDSLGNSGVIGPGDVQWMTAGGGIMHEEMTKRDADGSIYGFQLWVNLPAALKMTTPRYQELKEEAIPAVERDGYRVRVVTGEAHGVRGPVTEIAAHPTYMDVSLAPRAKFSIPLPQINTVLAYVFEGRGRFGEDEIESVNMAVFGEGDGIEICAGAEGTRFMVIAGEPFGEPIVPYGPFVMNTRQEIQQALEDLRAGTFVKENKSGLNPA
jgi:redox-sensitive bicupin YhaK (pirin superfamily)